MQAKKIITGKLYKISMRFDGKNHSIFKYLHIS
jgi:hypothetical protein